MSAARFAEDFALFKLVALGRGRASYKSDSGEDSFVACLVAASTGSAVVPERCFFVPFLDAFAGITVGGSCAETFLWASQDFLRLAGISEDGEYCSV